MDPHFGEGALRLEGNRLQKSLRPEIFSTPLLPLAWEESMGSFRASLPTRSLRSFPPRTHRFGGQVRGRGCGQEVPKSRVLSKE